MICEHSKYSHIFTTTRRQLMNFRIPYPSQILKTPTLFASKYTNQDLENTQYLQPSLCFSDHLVAIQTSHQGWWASHQANHDLPIHGVNGAIHAGLHMLKHIFRLWNLSCQTCNPHQHFKTAFPIHVMEVIFYIGGLYFLHHKHPRNETNDVFHIDSITSN